MRKKLMILGASILQLPAIKKSIELGLETIVVDINPNAIGFDIKNVQKEVISTVDIPNILKSAQIHQIDGIMTLATDMPMRSVAKVAEEMGLVGISMDTAIKATNKFEMRKALQNFGVPIPKYFKVSSRQEYLDAIKHFSSPFILKPADSSGSRGIFKITNINDKETIKNAYEYCKKYSKAGDVVVEEFMTGPEVSVETISIDGNCHVIQITDKFTTGAPHFVEMGHSQPTCLSKENSEKIAEVATRANKAIGIKNGPSHTEIIVTDDGPKIVEIGARLGGDNITTHLVPLSTGVDMVEVCIKIALGEKPIIKQKWNKGSAIRYLEPGIGKIVSIQGINDAEAVDGITQVSFTHTLGDYSNDIISSNDRIGFVISQKDTAKEAIEVCEKAIGKIKVGIEA